MRKKKDFRQQPWWILVFFISFLASPLLFPQNPVASFIFAIIVTQIIFKTVWRGLYKKSLDEEYAKYGDARRAKVMRELRDYVEGRK